MMRGPLHRGPNKQAPTRKVGLTALSSPAGARLDRYAVRAAELAPGLNPSQFSVITTPSRVRHTGTTRC